MGRSREPSFGELLSRYRGAAGFTQEELAERAGLSVGAISLLERGLRMAPRPRTVARLIATLGLGPQERQQLAAAGKRRPATSQPKVIVAAELSIPGTRFIGRECEVREVSALLARSDIRLLTLTGPPGAGKTRLALEVSAEVSGNYRDGVLALGLGTLDDPVQVMPAIRQALGLSEPRGRSSLEIVTAHYRDRQALLVLDNLEHLLSAGHELAGLLERCPDVQILVTSRAALRILTEHVFPVSALRLPSLDEERAGQPRTLSEVPAVILFAERASAAMPDFRVTAENASAVAAICRRLDGLPLALELAAPWIRLLTPQSILGQLESRLELLVAGARDLPERQRTMRSALAWSCGLLDGEARFLLRRLAIFQGSAPLDALDDVCQAAGRLRSGVLPNIAVLAEHALVLQHEADGRTARVDLLETVREYGRELLHSAGEYDQTAAAHLNYYVALAAEFEPHARSAEQASWLARLRSERDNIRAALRSASEHGAVESGLRLASSLTQFWIISGLRAEGLAWLNRLLDASGDVAPGVRGRALLAAGELGWRLGDHDHAVTCLRASLDIFEKLDDARGTAEATRSLGDAEGARCNYPEAKRLMETAIAAFRRLDARGPLAVALGNLGMYMSRTGDRRRATALYNESLSIQRELQDRIGMAMTLTNLGHQAQLAGNLALAESRLREAVAVARQLDVPYNLAAALANVSDIYRARGDIETARAGYQEAMDLFARLSDAPGVASCLRCMAWGSWAEGDLVLAARIYGAADTLSPVAASYDVDDAGLHARVRADLARRLSDQEYTVAYDAGSRMSMTEAVMEASAG